MSELSTILAGFTSLVVAAAGVIGGLVTWRKAASERTVSEAAIVDKRIREQDERMDKMQSVIDKLRHREQILVGYVYRLQGQVIRLGGEVPPWPAALDNNEENT